MSRLTAGITVCGVEFRRDRDGLYRAASGFSLRFVRGEWRAYVRLSSNGGHLDLGSAPDEAMRNALQIGIELETSVIQAATTRREELRRLLVASSQARGGPNATKE